MNDTIVQWWYNPWRHRPGRAWSAAIIVVAGAFLVGNMGLPAVVACALSAGLGASLGGALLPWHYRLDAGGVELGLGPFAQRRPWSEIKRAVRASDGVLLSPFERRHWLDGYRALFLPLPPGGGAGLAQDVHEQLAGHGL